jgi:hypothetical protein
MTAHGLLIAVVEKVKADGVFASLERCVTLKMKKRTYTVANKLATLWASIIVGCSHTVEINTKLGAQERAAAALFGLERFPDQSGVNDLLRACTQRTVDEVRKIHHWWMAHYTRARSRRFWHVLSSTRRVLLADIDQRALAVSGKAYRLATKGHFGRKRSTRGYQMSVCFLGGEIGEVLDEFFDPGNTAAGARVEDLLETLAWFADRHKIARRDVVVRGDAQYGTPGVIARVQGYGFSYLFKGRCSRRAQVLSRAIGPEAVFVLAQENREGERHWLTDLGEREHVGQPVEGPKPTVQTRTLVGVRVHWVSTRSARSRPGAKTRAKRGDATAPRRLEARWEYYLTNLTATDLPVAEVVAFYHERATIERYFNDEQNALGARHVRTHHAEGAAVFQWMVAMANNHLRRVQRTTFKQTPLAKLGLKRLIHTAMQVPAFVTRRGSKLIVSMPERHQIVQWLLGSWDRMHCGTAAPPLPDLAPAPGT